MWPQFPHFLKIAMCDAILEWVHTIMDAFYRKYFGKIALKSRMTPSSEARGGVFGKGRKHRVMGI